MFSDILFVLAPNEEKEIFVSFTSSYPIKLEEMIEIMVKNAESKFIRLKANCQIAECYLNQTCIKPDDIHISTPVKYGNNSFKMINPSNLPINFKWEKIDIPEQKYIIFFPEEGVVLPNSECEINYKMIFHTSKKIYY